MEALGHPPCQGAELLWHRPRQSHESNRNIPFPPLTSIFPEPQVNHGLADATVAYGLTNAAWLAGTMDEQLSDRVLSLENRHY